MKDFYEKLNLFDSKTKLEKTRILFQWTKTCFINLKEFQELIKNMTIDEEKGPIYKHDCNECIFLGTFSSKDLYFCKTEPTVIARYSDDGPGYFSGMTIAMHDGHNIYLAEALRRVLENPEYDDLIAKYLKEKLFFEGDKKALSKLIKKYKRSKV